MMALSGLRWLFEFFDLLAVLVLAPDGLAVLVLDFSVCARPANSLAVARMLGFFGFAALSPAVMRVMRFCDFCFDLPFADFATIVFPPKLNSLVCPRLSS